MCGWNMKGNQGSFQSGSGGPEEKNLRVGREHSFRGSTMSEGEKERSSWLSAGGHRTLVADEMQKA